MKRARAWLAALLAAVLLPACMGPDPERGTVWLTVELPAEPRVRGLAYELSSAGRALVARGIADVSAARLLAPIRADVAPGYRHMATVSAAAADGSLCAGVAGPFDVWSNWLTEVPVSVVCGDAALALLPPRPRLRGTGAGGDNCPVLTTWRASPLDTSVGKGAIDVLAAAADADPGDLLTYAWTSTAGSFRAGTAAQSTYTCTSAGGQSLMVTTSDNHEPVPCTASVAIPVTCHP